MTTRAQMELDPDERDLIRSLVIADPALVLDDDQVMRALLGQSDAGRQIVDLRDRLVQRLEQRLDKLMAANRSVIAAAYENVATTNQIHRAVLALIAPMDLKTFVARLTTDVPGMLGLQEARLCFEAEVDEAGPAEGFGEAVVVLPEGTIDAYLLLDGAAASKGVVLRPCGGEAEIIFGHRSDARSEALMRLDLGGGAAALLAFGSADPERFGPEQGVDLLTFLGGTVERLLAQRLAADRAG